MPLNHSVLEKFGPYPKYVTVGDRSTEVQRHVHDHGLGTVERGTQATLLALVQWAHDHAGGRQVQFFDIGAHIGFHSLLISSVYPAAAVGVTAFEPTPRTSATLRSLAAANRRQIRVERLAMSNSDGTAEFYISPWESSNSLAEGFRNAIDVVTVPTRRLDSYCAARSIRPDVVKIDVESYETQVLEGAIETLRTAKPSIVCEVLPGTAPEAIARAAAILTSCGYRLHLWKKADGWQECSSQDIVAMAPHDGNDWLFTPVRLDQAFKAALGEWHSAVAQCGKGGNIRLKRSNFPSPVPLHGATG